MRRNFLGKIGVEVYKDYERQRRKKRQEKQKEQLEKLRTDPEGEGRILLFKGFLFLGAVVYLAVEEAAKKWTMRQRDWAMIYSQLIIIFEDRLGKYV